MSTTIPSIGDMKTAMDDVSRFARAVSALKKNRAPLEIPKDKKYPAKDKKYSNGVNSWL